MLNFLTKRLYDRIRLLARGTPQNQTTIPAAPSIGPFQLFSRNSEATNDALKTSTKFTFQRGTLTLIAALAGPILIGGVVAEIFHSGQAYSAALSAYQGEADKEGKIGIELLTNSVNEGIQESSSLIAEGKEEALLAKRQAESEAGQIGGDWAQKLNAISTNQMLFQDVLSRQHIPYFQSILNALAAAQDALKGKHQISAGFQYQDPQTGFIGRKVFQVPHMLSDHEALCICAFQCIGISNSANGCVEDTNLASTEAQEQPTLTPVSASSSFSLDSAQRDRLNLYRQTLRQAEATIYFNALDIESRRTFDVRHGAANGWLELNQESVRTAKELQKVRYRLNLISEIELLASSIQRSELAASYLSHDLIGRAMSLELGDHAAGDSLSPVQLSEGLRRRLSELLDEIDRESEIGRSTLYVSGRPLLVSLWFSAGSGWRTIAILLGLLVCSATILSILHRKYGIPIWVVPAALLVFLVFPIQSALRHNLNIPKAGERLLKATLSGFEPFPFLQQGSGIKAKLIILGRSKKAEMINAARIEGARIKARTDIQGRIESTMLACQGGASVQVNDGFDSVKDMAGRLIDEGVDGAVTVLNRLAEYEEAWARNHRRSPPTHLPTSKSLFADELLRQQNHIRLTPNR
jgi:hypothetical protein